MQIRIASSDRTVGRAMTIARSGIPARPPVLSDSYLKRAPSSDSTGIAIVITSPAAAGLGNPAIQKKADPNSAALL